jgi:23S rRNA pseudouridine1911/1915/1917 synthase
MTKQLDLIVNHDENGLPLKTVLSHRAGLSRREISRLKFSHGLFLNGEQARVTAPVKEGDTIHLVFPEYDTAKAERIIGKPDILYEDEDCVVVNKPAGMPAHPSHEHLDDDMGSLLTSYYHHAFPIRPIGRLDKDVSGVMLYARSQPAAARLSRQRDQDVLRKEYIAIAQGIFEKKKDRVSFRLAKVPGRKDRVISEQGQLCITEYEVMEEVNGLSVLKVHLITGRTHQIRAGMAYLGHPLAGDRLYGGDPSLLHRPALHCFSLTFQQPFSGREIHVQADLPEEMKALLR